MKMHRWLSALVLALLLGACAPPNQGAGESPSEAAAPAAPTVEASPSESAEPMESPEASESPESTPDTYDY
jgi:PBP1b-binding outer membrane lipoprotein LpoB